MVQTAFMVMKTHGETSGEHLINQPMPSLSPTNHSILSSFHCILVLFLRLLLHQRISDTEMKLQAVNRECEFFSLQHPPPPLIFPNKLLNGLAGSATS